jgi:hypothetical protein
MKVKRHSLPSFSAWLNKGFDLRAHARRMADSRTDPEISPASVFLALFYSFVFRLPSFQQLDRELNHAYLQQWIDAERAFHDDTLRYSLCGFDQQPLEAMLVDVNRRLKRGKAFDEGRVQGRLVAALDGIEILSSFSRRCESCLERRVPGNHQGSGWSQDRADPTRWIVFRTGVWAYSASSNKISKKRLPYRSGKRFSKRNAAASSPSPGLQPLDGQERLDGAVDHLAADRTVVIL